MTKDKDRVYLARCVGKLMAYLRLDKRAEAKAWAGLLVDHLRKMGLIE